MTIRPRDLHDYNSRPTISLMTLADDEAVAQLIALARREDFGSGDLTAGLMRWPTEEATFALVSKQRGVFAGQEIAAPVLHAYDESIEISWQQARMDGMALEPSPTALATLRGPIGALLSAERVLLNFLQRMSGVASLTRRFVEAVEGTGATILDTRKTTPGWRTLDKYAVRCGGGCNHRQGLYDAVLIKDNHLAKVESGRLAGAVFEMLNRLSESGAAPAFVEIEADTLDQVEQLLTVVGIDVILLDNFAPEDIRSAVTLRDGYGLKGKVALEASGGITLAQARAMAETGVDRISVGALTHSVQALDLSLERR